MKNIKILLGIILLGFFGVFLYFNVFSGKSVTQEQVITKPVTLTIPKLNITAPVEHVAQDKDGNMDVPKNSDNVAWYELGPKPGEKGNAVIAGHYDDPEGPAVFYNIRNIEKGDEIKVTDDQGKELTFIVTEKTTYPDATFPIEKVFGEYDGSRLNLISCEGTFDEVTQEYSHRTVIFSELKQS